MRVVSQQHSLFCAECGRARNSALLTTSTRWNKVTTMAMDHLATTGHSTRILSEITTVIVDLSRPLPAPFSLPVVTEKKKGLLDV